MLGSLLSPAQDAPAEKSVEGFDPDPGVVTPEHVGSLKRVGEFRGGDRFDIDGAAFENGPECEVVAVGDRGADLILDMREHCSVDDDDAAGRVAAFTLKGIEGAVQDAAVKLWRAMNVSAVCVIVPRRANPT